MSINLSVVMISKNAANLLAASLSSIDWVDEIILLDSNSNDNTIKIALAAGAKVFISHDNWKGYGIQRQRAQHFATGNYILMIDTDEQLTPQLRHSIQSVLTDPEPGVVYSFSRRNYFLGRFMKYSGWYPDYVVRLYERKRYQYNDNQVHESLSFNGAKTVILNGDLLHFTCQDFSKFQRKQLNYAIIWARENHQRGKKTSLLSIFIYTFIAFLKTLLLSGGLFDGWRGWLLAIIQSQYTFNKYTELWALNLDYSNKSKL